MRSKILGVVAALFLAGCHGAPGASVLPGSFDAAAQAPAVAAPKIFVAVPDLSSPQSPKGSRLLEFGANASGNVAPSLRVPGFVSVANANRQREFLASRQIGQHMETGIYSSQGVLLRAVPSGNGLFVGMDARRNSFFVKPDGTQSPYAPCNFAGGVTLTEYAAGNESRPLRSLELGTQCVIPAVAFDGLGRTYVAQELWDERGLVTTTIAVYPAGASGSTKPIRTIGVPVDGDGAGYGIYQLAGDASGNLFMNCYGGLYEYPQGRRPWQRVLPRSVAVASFALDSHDNVYALVLDSYKGKNPSFTFTLTIQEFARGSTTP
ncbi:MAG TPA: hypothetical protein VK760_05910, partial [Candidatus Acidoferrales bacterium]|nr:hypothetical protein [Candidatus Acidoferrales bacterium]